MCYTGFRINEFLNLTPFSYDSKNNILTGGSKTTAGKTEMFRFTLRFFLLLKNGYQKKEKLFFVKKMALHILHGSSVKNATILL